ncbi:MAG: lysophospholipid acyltransferase family protein [Ignavibacteria bacterium]|nr:lysophospholipid acyltransferase family protein [Ignavibacteria bacterium]
MNLKKAQQDALRIASQFFITGGVTALCKSLKINVQNGVTVENLKSEKQNFVLAFWHGTMLLPWYLHGNPSFAALTSKSKDGDLLARILKKWKYNVVRGSSSVGGDVALGIMIDYTKNDYSIAITPDGPRGPRHKFKAGAVITAKKANVPIVLSGVGYKKRKVLKNWDKFEIPFFFSHAKIIYSDPIYISNELNYDETSDVIEECETQLNLLQQEAQVFSN